MKNKFILLFWHSADEGDKWKPKGLDTVLENNRGNSKLCSLSDDDASDECWTAQKSP